MIYGFIKENSDYISKDKQKKAIDQFASSKGWIIDRYLIDNYAKKYCQIYTIKRGFGTGSYVFDLNEGDILICSNLYTLSYSYKTILFLIKTALEQGAKLCSVEENIELKKTNLETINIIYNLQCFFNNLREEKTLRLFHQKKNLNVFKEEIKKLLEQGIPNKVICKKYNISTQCFRKFLDKNPELFRIYKKTNPYFKRATVKMLNRRPFLKKQVERYIRKVQASIVPTRTLLLAEKMEEENKI